MRCSCGGDLVELKQGGFLCRSCHREWEAPAEPATAEAHALLALSGQLPFPLALVLREYALESVPYVRLHRRVDAAELLTRFCALVLLADVHRLQHGEFPPQLRRALAHSLERPTFGAWRQIVLTAQSALPTGGRFLPTLGDYLQTRLLPALEGSAGTAGLIAVRNELAHGRLTAAIITGYLDAGQERFAGLWPPLVEEVGVLAGVRLVAVPEQGPPLDLTGMPAAGGAFPSSLGLQQIPVEPGRALLVHGNGKELDLFPLHTFGAVLQEPTGVDPHSAVAADSAPVDQPVPQLYFRLGDGGRAEFTVLGTEVPFGRASEAVAHAFEERFALAAWRQAERTGAEAERFGFEDVLVVADELVGRDAHLRQIKQALKEAKAGVLFLSGAPGVGKTALMARLVRDRLAGRVLTIPYFFRYPDPRCSSREFLRAMLLRIATSENRHVEVAADPRERQKQAVQALRHAAQRGPVHLLVDGLDEILAVEPYFAELLRELQGERIVWLCAGRVEPAVVDALQGATRVKFHAADTSQKGVHTSLPRLGSEAVRAMLVQGTDRAKYTLFARDAHREAVEGDALYNRFVETVTERADGLPLYVRMVVEDVCAGRRGFGPGEEERLPEGLAAYYDDRVEQYGGTDARSVASTLLGLLALGREPLPEAALRKLVERRDPRLMRQKGADRAFADALARVSPMLRRRLTPAKVMGWMLDHESFRRHLLDTVKLRVQRGAAGEVLLEVCAAWNEVGPELRGYALRQYIAHLLEMGHWDELENVLRDACFIRAFLAQVGSVELIANIRASFNAASGDRRYAFSCNSAVVNWLIEDHHAAVQLYTQLHASNPAGMVAAIRSGCVDVREISKLLHNWLDCQSFPSPNTGHTSSIIEAMIWALGACGESDELKQLEAETRKRLAIYEYYLADVNHYVTSLTFMFLDWFLGSVQSAISRPNLRT